MSGLGDPTRTTRRFLKGLILVFAVRVVPCLPSQNLAARTLPQRIREEMFVRIGGIEQWITIKGDDRNNPVVLFLHGGPGDALSPFADALFVGWEKDFTLVARGVMKRLDTFDAERFDDGFHGVFSIL